MATTEGELWELETRSEAVYLDAVSDDASSGFVARVCRFPAEHLAWVWLHIFHHGHVHSYTHHAVLCSADAVDEASDAVSYEAGEFRLSRKGDRFSPAGATLTASARLHSGPANPHGEGVLPCEIHAEFTPALAGVQSRAGRSEVLGVTRAAIQLGDVDIEIEARGQFHEQVQQDPRFNRPFSYATLRGDGHGCIFIRGVRGAAGTLTLDNRPGKITGVRMSPPGVVRKLEIDLEDGTTIPGEAIATYQYDVPLFHMVRPGTLVTARLGDARLSGCINDLVFAGLTFEHPA